MKVVSSCPTVYNKEKVLVSVWIFRYFNYNNTLMNFVDGHIWKQ